MHKTCLSALNTASIENSSTPPKMKLLYGHRWARYQYYSIQSWNANIFAAIHCKESVVDLVKDPAGKGIFNKIHYTTFAMKRTNGMRPFTPTAGALRHENPSDPELTASKRQLRFR